MPPPRPASDDTTSCTPMDGSPLLYVHVGLPVQPTRADWWPWPLTFWPWKVATESRVTCATSVPILVFIGPSVLELCPMYATDRQTDRLTDVRQTINYSVNKFITRHSTEARATMSLSQTEKECLKSVLQNVNGWSSPTAQWKRVPESWCRDRETMSSNVAVVWWWS